MPEPVIEKRAGLSPVWIVPLLAVCIAGWLLYTSYRDAGIEIILHAGSAQGIAANKTPVLFRGMQVGKIKGITVGKDLQGVELLVEMVKGAGPYLGDDAEFWVEKIDVEAGRVTGLDTLLSGSYIGFQPGSSEHPARSFSVLEHRPPIPADTPGLHLKLTAPTLASLQIGSGIYYRDLGIGSVQAYELVDDIGVIVDVYIEPEYAELVKEGSRFWNTSGVSISGGVTDLKIRIPSLAAVVKGGISMDTPEALRDGIPARNGQTFTLYEDEDAAVYGVPLTLEIVSGEGIQEGFTKVLYRGMQLGVVEKVTINRNERHTVTAHVLLDPRAEQVLNSGTTFYLVKPQLSWKGVRNIDSLVTGAYFTFAIGEGSPQRHFVVSEEDLPGDYARQHPDGLTVQLLTTSLESITVGSSIFYKNVAVGEVIDYRLREKEDDILITGLIEKRYRGLVRTTSRFFNQSGVDLEASLDGVRLRTGSLESMVSGGVGFYTPGDGERAENGARFNLHESQADAEKSDRLAIAISFANTTGLKPGMQIRYYEIAIGEVLTTSFENQMKGIKVNAAVDREAESLLNEGSRFRLVRPEFSLTGTQYLDTLITGPYIEIVPGAGGPAREFSAVAEPGENDKSRDGLRLLLESDELFSLKSGSPVYYRRFKVGRVTAVGLTENLRKVRIEIEIFAPYTRLVRQHTVFWNATGVRVEGGVFSGITVATESLEALLGGAIGMATPDNEQMGEPVASGQVFTLFAEMQQQWLGWSPVFEPEKDEMHIEEQIVR